MKIISIIGMVIHLVIISNLIAACYFLFQFSACGSLLEMMMSFVVLLRSYERSPF